MVAQPFGLGFHRVAHAGAMIQNPVDHAGDLRTLFLQHLGDATGAFLRRGFHCRGLVLAGLAEAFALLFHHAHHLGEDAALLGEGAFHILAAGTRSLGGGVDVAGLRAEQSARAVERGRRFFRRQAQIHRLAAQRFGDRMDAMLRRLVGEGQLSQPARQRVGMLFQRLPAQHESDQQPQQQDRRCNAGHRHAQLVRQHAGEHVGPDKGEHIPGDTDEPQHGGCAGGHTPDPPIAEIGHVILPHDPPAGLPHPRSRINPFDARRLFVGVGSI